MFHFNPNNLKAEKFDWLMVKGCYNLGLCLRFDRLFAFGFYHKYVTGCRMVFPGRLCPGCKMCVKGVALACNCDLVLGWRHQVCDQCMPDLKPSSGSLSFPCKSAAPCLDGGPTPALSVPPEAPLPVALVTSVLARASPEPSCSAWTRQVLVESSNQSHSEENRN